MNEMVRSPTECNEMARGKEIEKKDTFGTVTSKVMELLNRDWSTLVSEFRAEHGASDSLQLRALNIADRRREEAYATRDEFAKWLISNGTQDEHRISAYRVASSQPWPRSSRVSAMPELANELFNSSEEPRFRAKIIPLISNFIPPETFLSRTSREVNAVRVAAVNAIASRVMEAWNSTAISSYLQQYQPILQRLAKEDESREVRQAAEEALADINDRKRPKE